MTVEKLTARLRALQEEAAAYEARGEHDRADAVRDDIHATEERLGRARPARRAPANRLRGHGKETRG